MAVNEQLSTYNNQLFLQTAYMAVNLASVNSEYGLDLQAAYMEVNREVYNANWLRTLQDLHGG